MMDGRGEVLLAYLSFSAFYRPTHLTESRKLAGRRNYKNDAEAKKSRPLDEVYSFSIFESITAGNAVSLLDQMKSLHSSALSC